MEDALMARVFTVGWTAGWAAALLVWALVLPTAAETGKPVYKNGDDIAILGYDTVAYFTESRAVRGKPEFEHVWNGARWLFAKPEHRDRFSRDPEAYAPRFGGFCTGGMSLGYIQEANPENWAIIKGRLYLKNSKSGLERLEEVVGSADANWPVVSQQDPVVPRPCTTCAKQTD
jgi:hypothetical protein